MRLFLILLLVLVFDVFLIGCASQMQKEEDPFKGTVCCMFVLSDKEGHVNCRNGYILAKKNEVVRTGPFDAVILGQAKKNSDGTYTITNVMQCEVNK